MPDSTYRRLAALPADSLTVEQRDLVHRENQVRARRAHQMDPVAKTLIALGVMSAVVFAAIHIPVL